VPDDTILKLLSTGASAGIFGVLFVWYLFKVDPANRRQAESERKELVTAYSTESERQRDIFREEAGEQRDLYREEQVAARAQHQESLDKLIVVLIDKKKD
jgi:hypothetical protein